MIFTRRFGTLRARQTFPSVTVIDVEEFEAQRKAELAGHKHEPKVHHLFKRHHKVSTGSKHAA